MAFSPIYMTDAVLSLGATEFQAEVSSAMFTPNAANATWKGLTPGAVHTHTSLATWTLDITLAQDYDEAASLARYLLENEGSEITAQLTPRKAGGTGKGYQATVIVTPATIGGAVDSFATGSVSLGVKGKPASIV